MSSQRFLPAGFVHSFIERGVAIWALGNGSSLADTDFRIAGLALEGSGFPGFFARVSCHVSPQQQVKFGCDEALQGRRYLDPS
jgi:hypothetical protein